ncbi:MAG: hypothetical protein WDZ52_02340 [Pseudohongiellaceae bacterium]
MGVSMKAMSAVMAIILFSHNLFSSSFIAGWFGNRRVADSQNP